MRSAIVAIYNIFFACLVFWGISCGQSNTPYPETDPNNSVTDLHVDQLNTGNVEQIALSTRTSGYYNQYWSGLTYYRSGYLADNTVGGTIVQYLDVSTANYGVNQGTWVVQDISLTTSSLFEVIDTDTVYPKLAVKSNVSTITRTAGEFKGVRSGSNAYCVNANCSGGCYNITTGASVAGTNGCSSTSSQAYPLPVYGVWVKYTDTTNTTHSYLNWVAVDSIGQPTLSNLSASLTYISSDYDTNDGFGVLNLDVNSDANAGPSGMNFSNNTDDTVSVLVRMEDCRVEDALTLDNATWTIAGNGNVSTGGTTYATYSTGSLTSEDYTSFSVNTASTNQFCDTTFVFNNSSQISNVISLLRKLQYKNTATTGNATEGTRTIAVFLRRENNGNSNQDYAFVSKPEIIEVDVWNPPVLTETTPVTTPTLDSTPSITLTSTKAGTISFTGGCSSDTTTLIAGSNTIDLAADTNGSGLSDGTYSCTVQLTETETGASLTSDVLTLTTFVVDTTAPQISITTDIGNANGYVNSLTPSIVLESDEAGDVVLANCSNTASMTNQTVTVSANNTVTFDTLVDGTTYAGCEITVVDSVGNTSSAVIAATFTVDATAPTISLSPSTAFSTQDTTPDVVLTSDEAGSISFTNCTSATTAIFATDNTITLQANGGGAFLEGTYSTCSMTVTDIADNTASITVPSMSIDLTGPTISIAAQVTSPTNSATPSFSLTSNEVGTATIAGDCSGSVSVTASTQTVSMGTLTDGTYSNCTVVVTDEAGNTSNTVNLSAFEVDLTAPSAPVITLITTDTTVFSVVGVDAITNVADVEFQGTTDADTSLVVTITDSSNTAVTCDVSSVNTGAGTWVCNNDTDNQDTYSLDLSDDSYTVTAVASDAAGNTTSTEADFILLVDTTAPSISETTAVAANANPANRSTDPTPDVVLTPNEDGVLTVGGDCDNTADAVVGSTTNTITLYYTTGGGFPDVANNNPYTCSVYVTDAAGNDSSSIDLTDFSINVGAPTITEVTPVDAATGSSLTSNTTPTVVIDSTAAIDTNNAGELIVFGGNCASTTISTLSVGNNTITLDLSTNLSADGTYSNCTLLVNDGANVSNTITLTSFTVDTQGPVFVSNVNDFSILEHSSAGTTVGTVQVSDATPVTFSEGVGETGDSVFQISSTGIITLSSGQNLDYETTASYDYNVIVTDATGASTNQTFTIAVSDANDAPSLDSNYVSNFATITEDDTSNAGTIVSALLVDGGNNPAISDVDANAVQGIVVYSANDSNGTWQYSTNSGVSWTNFPTVSATSALLLSDSAYVRFVPDAARADSASFSFYAWDQASGSEGSTVGVSSRGGGTAFSTANATVSITVTDINDAPVLSNATPVTLLPVITEDNITSSGYLVSTIIGATITDPDANASTGIALNSASSTHGEWEYSTDNGGTWNGVGALTTNDVLPLLPTHLIRFVPDQENGAIASVSFYAWDTTTDTEGLGVTIASTGGSTAYSTAIGTANLTVVPVNDAPVLDNNVTANFSTISESIDSASNTGELVSTLLGSGMSDVDTVSQDGIAIYSTDARNGTWQYSTDNASTWNSLGTPSTTQARLLRSDSNARVRFVPNSNFSTATVANPATISFYAWDGSVGSNGGTRNVTTTGGTTAFSTASATSSIVVTDTNDAPVLTAGSVVNLTSITEDDVTNIANDGDVLSTIIGSAISDPDSNTAAEGVAVYNVTATNGKWQYAVDGSTWTDFGSVSETAAILLESDSTTRIRFLPNGQNGVTATLSFYAWDVTDGNTAESSVDVSSANRGQDTAFSTTAGTTTIVVTSVNDAPVLGSSVADFTTITENDTATADNPGNLINDILNGQLTDVDTGAVFGIAVYGVSAGNSGHWEYSTDAGSTWTTMPNVSMNAAILLAGSSYIRFMPDGSTGESATISFYGWDKRTGSETGLVNLGALTLGGTTAYSTTNATASITVTDLNDAPVLNNASPYTLTPITEDNSSGTITDYLISDIIGSTITDSDTGSVKGLAISSASTTNGYWEYSTDSGVNWNGFGSGVSTSAAVLLSSNAMVRFVTDLENGTTATMSVYAWDQTTGSEGSTADVTTANRGGTTAFSSNGNTISLVVSDVNDAPVLTAANITDFTTITEDDTSNTGSLISSLLTLSGTAAVEDVDSGTAYGLAVYASSASNGTWQYTVDGGSNWSNLGTPSASQARLLTSNANTRIRFVPNAVHSGAGTLSVYAWDATSGANGGTGSVATVGGISAFSSSSATINITVNALNDAPVLGTTNNVANINEDDVTPNGTLISSIITSSDVDPTSVASGIAVYGVTQTNGTWEYSLDGNTWIAFGSVSTSAARLLDSGDYIRFVPDAENGDTPTLSLYAWDQTAGSVGGTASVASVGTTTPYSSASATIGLTVTSVNDAPVLTAGVGNFSTITEDQTTNSGNTANSLLNGRDSDVDSGALRGIAVYQTTVATGSGTWQYSTDLGVNWSNIGTVSATSALVLRSWDSIRFLPDGENNASGSVDFVAWDGASTLRGTKVDSSTRGTTSNFSVITGTSSITVTDVNDTPTVTAIDATYVEGDLSTAITSISVDDVDTNEQVTVTLTLNAVNWPDDSHAPNGSGSRYFSDGNGGLVILDVTDVYGGYLQTTNYSWLNSQLQFTGTVADVNAELQTLEFIPTANYNSGANYNSDTIPDYDLDSIISVHIEDAGGPLATAALSSTSTMDFTCATRDNDRPVAIGYWDAYNTRNGARNETASDLIASLDATNYQGKFIRVDAGMSWDPDFTDSVVSYTFTPNVPVVITCNGSPTALDAATGCTPNNSVDYIVQDAQLTTVIWTITVNDGTTNNTVMDLYDQVVVSVANTAPHVAIFAGDSDFTCSRAHAKAYDNPTYVDENLDCFCDESSCNNSSTCADSQGRSCNPSRTQINTCTEIPAVYVDATGECFCEEMDCDGVDSNGDDNCFDSNNDPCTPVLNSNGVQQDYCAPIVSPINFSYPFDLDVDLKACTFDENDDPLIFTWSTNFTGRTNIVPQSGFNFSSSSRTAQLSVVPTDYAAQYGDINVELDVYDGEDHTIHSIDLNFCSGWFEDLDGDGYGSNSVYIANCSSFINPYHVSVPQNGATSVVQGSDYSGVDCWDDPTVDIVDTNTLVGSLASATSYSAADIKDEIHWFIDYDNDGYGATSLTYDNQTYFPNASPTLVAVTDDDADQNGFLDTTQGTTAVLPLVWPGSCQLTPPSTVDRTGRTVHYVLNQDDCNDSRSFVDGDYANYLSPSTNGTNVNGAGTTVPAGVRRGSNRQNPETIWYADVDGDGFSATLSTFAITDGYVYFDSNLDCMCKSDCGSLSACYAVVNNASRATNAVSATCVPTGSCTAYAGQYRQCEHPLESSATQNVTNIPSGWFLDNSAGKGDCNETTSAINEGESEVCDPGDVDENCNNLADDNDSNVLGAFSYFADADSDGYPTRVGKSVSCDGGSVTGYSLVNYYTLSNPDGLTAGQNCICPTNTCDVGCRLASNRSVSCAPAPGDAPVCTNVNNIAIGTAYDFTATEFTDFALYVEDCNDGSVGIYPRATEVCDGVRNDCMLRSQGTPVTEVDYDNDRYVECYFDGSTWRGSAAPLVGSDCSPNDANVYPNAASICDGQYNNCASWRDEYADETGTCFCAGVRTDGSCNPGYCTDAAGFSCTPTDLDADGFLTCTATGDKKSPGAPADQTDNDGDCYVECFNGATSWVGDIALLGANCSTILEGEDCNDTSNLVYPDAIEVCDGQFNNCNSPAFVATGAPVNETDNDGDGYVECNAGEYIDMQGCRCTVGVDSNADGVVDSYSSCRNSRNQTCVPDLPTMSAVTWVTGNTGYSDCDDLNDTRYPTASDICDGIFNDCTHPLLSPFVGATGEDCYCPANSTANCKNTAGNTCVPTKELVALTNPMTIAASNYGYQETECYCPTASAQIDIDTDGLSDCLDQNKRPCQPTDADGDGFGDTVITSPLNATTLLPISKSMYTLGQAPGRELDNDGDRYVECNYAAALWVGSAYVVGGNDCNDFPTNSGNRIYPGATERCDGVYNNCSDPTYSATTAPASESDVDNDGYVACSLTPGFGWVGGAAPGGYGDCIDTNFLVYPGAIELCDGVYNNCSISNYSLTGAPTSEVDNDGDGYVDCSNEEYIDANACLCTSAVDVNVDGVFDSNDTYADCENINGQLCVPDLNTIAMVAWAGPEVDGYEDCNDLVAVVYPAAEEICDGRFNNCSDPLNPLNPDTAGMYTGVVGNCFCPNTTCLIDVDLDGNSDCVDSAGLACDPTDDNNDGYADNCALSSDSMVIANSNYFTVQAECYCPTPECGYDFQADGLSRCYAPNGDACQAPLDANNFYVDCASNPATTAGNFTYVFRKPNGAQVTQPFDEIDNDGDRYVDCPAFDRAAWTAAGSSVQVLDGNDCDDKDARVYPNATEYCDGQFNNCNDVAFSLTGAPATETDDDGDGYVECSLTNGVPWAIADTNPLGAGIHYKDSFGCYCDGPCGGAGTTCADYSGSACLPVVATCVTVGGFSDCDDTDAWVFPTAPALCDGQYNDCSGPNFSLTVVPPVESDVDGDGYVQCADDGSVWRGPVQPVGYGDCSDTDASTNGGAPEVCDGIFNDCNHPQKFPFEGVVGDCYCPTTDCLIDNGQGSQCVDITGATCTPVDENNDNHADYCNASLSVIAIAGRQYRGVEVECYCPTESCQLDTTSDGVVDCLTPTGQVCATLDDGNGFAASCAQGTPTPHVFTKANGTALTGPMDETDHDGDGFVECEYQAASWEGSLSVHGGLDCDDTDALVHPGATEYCDGQYNNCSDLTYNANSAPANESDVDQDGYVACGFTNGVPWARANVPTDDGDCEDTDATVYPTAIEVCDGQYNNCSTFGYSLNGAPANETDNDGDGYVDCPSGQYLDTNGCMCASVTDSNGDGIPDVFNSCSNATGAVCTPDAGSISAVVWAGRTQISGYSDCQDANVRMYPGAPESCDGIFNNCNHPQKSAYHGVVSDCFCPTLDTNGDGTRDTCVASNCVDSAGATCSPVDEDNNGYVDPEFCYISTTPEVVNAQNYYGAEVDCYCPNDSCQIDVLSNGLSDCLTPRGETCIPTDSINVGFADNCVDGFTVSHTFTLGNGSALTRPFDEMDNDGDGYVECTYQPAIWLGSFSVVGGLDCDDYDDAVYPTAQEVCDGQYNDCLNNYVVNGAPANEVDNDGDGWVECARDSDVVWNAYNGVDMVNIRGYGTDGTINGTIECICSDSACSQDCTTPQGATCTVLPQYCAPHESYENVDCDDTDFYAHPYLAYNESANIARALSIASCLRDRDGDGYGDSSPVNTAVTAGRDCDDLNQLVHPEQNEVCEVGTQVDSDCNGDVNTADYAAGYLLDTNGNGSLLYVDDDGDGFGDSRTAATPACEVAPGFVFNATDCNDDNANINPTAKEICDGVDQDCDLTIDEAESLDTPSISKCTYMYRDVDGDSYGDADYAACLCQEGSNSSVTYNDYEYVIYSGDCYDFNADIRPLSCSDGIDQDDDGFVDARDSDCIAGYEEGSTTTKEQAFELIDGHDNNCDGLVAAIELDCDDDGSFPSIPAESIGFNRSNKFQLAAEIGLEACSGLSTNLSCWNEQQRLVCDQLTAEIVDGNIEYNGTGLWMLPINESDDGFGNRFKGGHREYPNGVVCGSALGDCDDQCADRCPGKREECDGLDNNCSNATPGTDGGVADAYKGFPDSLIASVPVAGTISDVEIDIDSDGFLACDNFTSTGQETQWSDASCGSSGGMSEDNDCNNFCFFSSPNAEERCDAFQGVCGGEKLDGVDTDYDDMLTCGTWGADDTLTEDVYVVVWLKNVNWSELASEEQELIRPVTSADQIAEALSDSGLDREDTALDDGLLDSGDTGYSMQETERERLFRKRANFVSNRVPIMNTNGLLGGDVDVELLENMIPLVAPRNLAPYCDSYLSDQLTLLLGQNNMQALRTATIEEEADILLQACELDDAAGCAIVRLSLSKTTDDDTYDYLDSIQSQILSFSDECEARPEEWVSRTMWQRDRIVEARRLTVEWECRRMYGKACNEISSQTRLSSDWMDSMVSAERWLDTDRVWFKELGRYNPAPIDDGTMMSCWGDPSDETTKLNERVGGDCNDDNNEAHRDMPEGPGDLVGIYLYGETADCSTCLDGIDNNCDGAIDCADPACAPCFVGQGVGCGGGADSPCSQGGCSSPDQGGQDRLYKSIALIMMALVVSMVRRRENA